MTLDEAQLAWDKGEISWERMERALIADGFVDIVNCSDLKEDIKKVLVFLLERE